MSGGQQITVGQGSLTVRRGGLGIVVSQGQIVFEGSAVTVNISGSEIVSDIDSFRTAGQGLSGIAITPATGAAPYARAQAVTGVSSSFATGTVVPGINADDTFIQSASGSVAQSASLALSGQQIAISPGSVLTNVLSGASLSFATGTLTVLRTAVSSGQQATVSGGTITAQGGTQPQPGQGGGGGGGGGRFYAHIPAYEAPTIKKRRVDVLLAKQERLQAKVNKQYKATDYNVEAISRLLAEIQIVKLELEKMIIQSEAIAVYVEQKARERRQRKDEEDLITIMNNL